MNTLLTLAIFIFTLCGKLLFNLSLWLDGASMRLRAYRYSRKEPPLKAQFSEEYINQEHQPLDPTTYDFDWQSLFAILDGEDLTQADKIALREALKPLLKWVIEGEDGKAKSSAKMIARRTFALLWVINPAYFDEGVSLSQLAKHLGLHKQSLSILAAEVTRVFGIQNSHQQHGWNRHD